MHSAYDETLCMHAFAEKTACALPTERASSDSKEGLCEGLSQYGGSTEKIGEKENVRAKPRISKLVTD
jgi:hypothetical protein